MHLVAVETKMKSFVGQSHGFNESISESNELNESNESHVECLFDESQ